MTTRHSKKALLPKRGNSVTTQKSSQAIRSHVADTWRWMWPDLLMRIIPMAILPFLYIGIFQLPPAFLGLTTGNILQQTLLGGLIGSLMCLFAIGYRMYVVGPWFRRPTRNDHLLQSFFYLCINAPVEELFFRGFGT
jgi:hypothetical protein